MNIKKIPDTFEGVGDMKGFVFEKKYEDKETYIYSAEKGGVKHYEKFQKRLTPILINFEERTYSETDFKEVYPKSKDFGKWANMCTEIELNKILQEV